MNDSGKHFTKPSDKRQIQNFEQPEFEPAARKWTRDELLIQHVSDRAAANAHNRNSLSADDFVYRMHFTDFYRDLNGLECFFLSVEPTQKIKTWIEEKKIWVIVWPEHIHVYKKKDNKLVTFESCLRDDLFRLHVLRCSDAETTKSTPRLDRGYQYHIKTSGRHENMNGLQCSCLSVQRNRMIKVWVNQVKMWFRLLPRNIEVFSKYGNPVCLDSISRPKIPAQCKMRGLVPYVKSWLGVQGSLCIVYQVPASCRLSSILRKGNEVRESKDENNRLWRRAHERKPWRKGGVCMERHFLYTILESDDGN